MHVVCIGNISKAPRGPNQYIKQGYKLVVHTSAEELIEGFQPYMLKAYR